MKIFNASTHRYVCAIALFGGAMMLCGCVKFSSNSTAKSPTKRAKPTYEDSSELLKNSGPLVGTGKAEWLQKLAPREMTAKPKDIALVAVPVN